MTPLFKTIRRILPPSHQALPGGHTHIFHKSTYAQIKPAQQLIQIRSALLPLMALSIMALSCSTEPRDHSYTQNPANSQTDSPHTANSPAHAAHIYLSPAPRLNLSNPTSHSSRLFYVHSCTEDTGDSSSRNCEILLSEDGQPLLFEASPDTTGEALNSLHPYFSPRPSSTFNGSTQLSGGAAVLTAAPVTSLRALSGAPSLTNILRGQKWVQMIIAGIATAAAGTAVIGRFISSPGSMTDISFSWAPTPGSIPQETINTLEKIYTSPSTSPSEKGSPNRSPRGGPARDQPAFVIEDDPPFILPVPENDPEPEIITNPLERFEQIKECQDLLIPTEPSGTPYASLLSLPGIEKIGIDLDEITECKALLSSEGIEINTDREAQSEASELQDLIDDECLHLLYPLGPADARPHIIKPPANPPFVPPPPPAPPSPKVRSFCGHQLANSPHQAEIAEHIARHEEQSRPDIFGGGGEGSGDGLGLSPSSRRTSSEQSTAHQASRAYTTEEICQNILVLASTLTAAERQNPQWSQLIDHCRGYMSYLHAITDYIKNQPITHEALAANPLYRDLLERHLKSIMHRPSLYENHTLTLAEVAETIEYQREVMRSDTATDLLKGEAMGLTRLTSRLFELQNDLPLGELSAHTDDLATASEYLDPLPDLAEHTSTLLRIQELQAKVELEHREVATMPLPQTPSLEESIYKQLATYRERLELVETLSLLRVEYFALIDGKRSTNYSAQELKSMKHLRALDKIRELPPSEFLDPDEVSRVVEELSRGLFHAYYTAQPGWIQRFLYQDEGTFDEIVLKLTKIMHSPAHRERLEIMSLTVGEHIRFLRLMLLAIDQKIPMIELSPADIFSVDQDSRLSELAAHDPYAQLPHNLIMDNLATVIQQFKVTRRSSARNPFKRLFTNPNYIEQFDHEQLRERIQEIRDKDDGNDLALPTFIKK